MNQNQFICVNNPCIYIVLRTVDKDAGDPARGMGGLGLCCLVAAAKVQGCTEVPPTDIHCRVPGLFIPGSFDLLSANGHCHRAVSAMPPGALSGALRAFGSRPQPAGEGLATVDLGGGILDDCGRNMGPPPSPARVCRVGALSPI